MARADVESILGKLRKMSEEGVTSVFNEVMGNQRLRRGLGKAGEQFMHNKASFDRNVETVLDFVNIPSKKDVRELKSRLDHLSSQLLNLSIKLDRVLAKEKPVAASKRHPKK
jgi:polyhydroxyalkanoate synthesis regulator phasin